MAKRILVAYASGTGSTAEVAQAIGTVLQTSEADVVVRNVNAVRDLSNYSAFVIGSSIRAGRWLPAAVTFLKDFGSEIGNRPVALFTTCLTMVNDNLHNRKTVLSYLEPILIMLNQVKPAGIGLFAGSLDPNRLHIMEGLQGPHGDYRNWEAIQQWAAEVEPILLTGEATTETGRGYDLSETVLSFTNLTHADLSYIDLHETELYKAILHQANLSHANLQDTNLQLADLSGANLEGAHLHWANLGGCNLHEANLHEANLIGADLKAADLSGANLAGAILNGANLHKANLQTASLQIADLNWVDFSQANLSGADLTAANLGWADLSEANLTDTVLVDVRYNHFTHWPDDFSPQAAGCIAVGEHSAA